MAISTDLPGVGRGWFPTPPTLPTAEPASCEPIDVVETDHTDPDLLAMQDLRSFSRGCRPLVPPPPNEVVMPDVPSAPARSTPVFRGKAPLPRKLDVHSVVSGDKVARAARRWRGTRARDLTGQLPGFADTTGMPETGYGLTNQCANFVSTFAQRLGLKGHYLSVPQLREALERQGWKKVSAQNARPGDVWMSGSHTELVTRAAFGRNSLPEVTGSNNGGNYHQTISSHRQGGGSFYTRPVWREQS